VDASAFGRVNPRGTPHERATTRERLDARRAAWNDCAPAMRPLRSLLTAALLGATLGTGGLVALADPPRGGFPPDPPARASRKQWSIEIAARGAKVTPERATSTTLDKPAESARVFGRFALELYIGKELLDRVRFNVPLMGDEPPQGNRNKLPRPRFDKNVTAHLTVRIADNPRAAYLLLVDRETGATQKLEWPPAADGRLAPWKSGLTDAKPGDVPTGGVRAAGIRDGGAADAGQPRDAEPPDAKRD